MIAANNQTEYRKIHCTAQEYKSDSVKSRKNPAEDEPQSPRDTRPPESNGLGRCSGDSPAVSKATRIPNPRVWQLTPKARAAIEGKPVQRIPSKADSERLSLRTNTVSRPVVWGQKGVDSAAATYVAADDKGQKRYGGKGAFSTIL